MRLISKQLDTCVSLVILTFIALVIPFTCAKNDATEYSRILDGNHTEKLYWTKDNEDRHTLTCTLLDGVEPDIFEWTYGDGSEINSTDIVNCTETTDENDRRTLMLEFVNITYFIADVFMCRAVEVEWDDTGTINKTVINATTISIFVQESKKLELIIGMSAAAVVFFIISLIVIKLL